MPNSSQPESRFPSTRWTWVMQARDVDPAIRRDALGQLLQTYSPALVAYLTYGPRRLSLDEAEEIVQGFLTDKLVERDLFAKADPAKGRLRNLVLKSLNNYFLDQVRAKKPNAPLPDEDDLIVDIRSTRSADLFVRAWAKQVLEESMQRMCAECDAEGKQQRWQLFCKRVIQPARDNSAPTDYQSLLGEFNFASPQQASNALMTAKRHFGRVLENVVGQYVPEEEIEAEIHDLRRAVAEAGPIGALLVESSAQADEPQRRDLPPDESSQSLWAMMLDPKPDRDTLWSDEDLLDHQMRLPLAEILHGPDETIPLLLSKASATSHASRLGAGSGEDAAVGSSLATLADLFAHPAPPLALLDGVKRWARRATRSDDSQLPSEISSLIYFAAIAAALVLHNERITKSDDATLRFGFERLLAQREVNAHLSSLIRSAASRLPPQG